MKDLIAQLSGKKTYTIVVIGCAYYFALAQGWIKPVPEFGEIITLLGLAALRDGIKSSSSSNPPAQ
jgi:hypothetical protein